MRGKLNRAVLQGILQGITPADAGKTAFEASQRRVRQDHPRGCGENTAIAASMPINIGSPPRMRGKQFNTLRKTVTDGITPADAGKTYHRSL